MFFLLVTEILKEKEKKLKEFLIFSGMKNGSYWLSWISIMIICSFYNTGITIASGYIMKWEVFLNIPIPILFTYFFLSNFSMLSLGLLLVAVSPSSKAGYNIAYTFVLLNFVFQAFLVDPCSMEFIYAERPMKVLIWMRYIFEYYVGYNYIKLWSDISYISGPHLVLEKSLYYPGRKLTYEDMFLPRITKLPDGYSSYLCPPAHTMLQMLYNTIWMLVLGWVLDNFQIPNHSVTLRNLFCLKKSKDFGKIERAKDSECERERLRSRSGSSDILGGSDDFKMPLFSSGVDQSVKSEYFATVDEMVKWRKFQGVLINNIGKTYRKYPFGITSKHDHQAVKNIFLRVEKGELLSVLGQNGAGKTSLINVITGHLKQTTGNVKIFGLDLNKNNEEVKELVSLCPQFDVCWDTLTVYEHLELFSSIKGVKENLIVEKVEKLIKDVGLWDRKDHKVQELSGGMKRRLSIAMSTLGNPRVVIFDEPTTGLDPVTQKEIMNLIEVKKIILFSKFFFKIFQNYFLKF